MTKRRAKFSRHSGKMIKLFKDLFHVRAANSSRLLASVKMRPARLKQAASYLALITLLITQIDSEALEARRTLNSFSSAGSSGRQERGRKLAEPLELRQPDPMEPCYLANNRASETLTISESTPVGTVVGELMVNGDCSSGGNIELSIKMPASLSASDSMESPVAKGQRRDHTNAYASTLEPAHWVPGEPPTDPSSQRKQQQGHQIGQANVGGLGGRSKSGGHLGNLIDLMPPLSIEPHTKRLILAKKLDRENLERYTQAGSFQSSFSSINSLSQASGDSLTVHIKCQLKEEGKRDAPLAHVGPAWLREGNSTNSTLGEHAGSKSAGASKPAARGSSANSILIPIHLIVTDENDNWPSFIGSPYIIDLNESAPVGSLVPGNEIVALDNDQQGPLSTIEYSVVPGSFHSDSFAFLNPLDARSLIVKDNRALDYEGQARLQLKVMARDQGEPANWAISSLFINLLDQDDLGPVFECDQYRAEVRENRPGELIELLPRRLQAHDGDKQLAAPVAYAFHLRTNHSVHFELDADLGALRLKKALPEAALEQPFCLLVRASQVDNEQRSSVAAVQLQLATNLAELAGRKLERLLEGGNRSGTASRDGQRQEEQDHALDHDGDQARLERRVQFARANYALEMSESAAVGTTVFTARAGRSPAISYQLLDNEPGYLSIEPQSGRVRLNRSLDFELARQISVRILATLELHDDPSAVYPKLACDITRLQVNVLNFNDFKPEFSHEQYHFQLSISDLIANFEPAPQAPRNLENSDRQVATTHSSSAGAGAGEGALEGALSGFGRRLGEADSEDEAEARELADYRGIQLGQVYCADRDFGDKVSLTLAGNKAHLFRLTQDGRLYLPLVNVTSEQAARGSSHEARPTARELDRAPGGAAWEWRAEQQISNKLTPITRRPFSPTGRRNELLAAPPLDRNYLNYLLSELGQLGRLRLKVHASDDGQPTAKQSSALVVVSIISIDNFIIQRDQSRSTGSLPSGPAASVQLTNDTSYQTGAASVMMIPSTDGRSFVHINPDILGNLLAGQNTSSGARDPGAAASSAPDSLELSASSPASNAATSDQSGRAVADRRDPSWSQANGRQQQQQQPPGLLLVDEQGAKFVAMPAAIEVYQQQVQEAAEQQTRRKQARELERQAEWSLRQSVWRLWSGKLSGRGESEPVDWLNVWAASMLQLLVVAALVMLLTRLRSSLLAVRARDHLDGHNSHRGPPSDSDLWPRRLGRLSAYFGDKSSSLDQAASILRRHEVSVARASYERQPVVEQSAGGESQYNAFLGHTEHRERRPVSPRGSPFVSESKRAEPTRAPQPELVSSGAVVRAISNKMQSPLSRGESPRQHQRQNLFEHLKLTLNKMLDTSAEPHAQAGSPEAVMSELSMRPLDSEVVAFEDMRARELELCAQLRERGELRSPPPPPPAQQQQRKKSSANDKAAVSTFVGCSAPIAGNSPAKSRPESMSASTQHHSQSANTSRATSERAQNGAVVSINIKGPAPEVPRGTPAPASSSGGAGLAGQAKQVSGAHSSWNSSVISLVSVSSSLSNKISEAVGRAGSEQANGSDASSLNSSILLANGVGSASSCSSSGRGQTKLARGSPPPPPGPTQWRGRLGSPHRGKEPTSGDREQLERAAAGRSASLRQRPPENPAHVRLRGQAMCEPVPATARATARERSSATPGRTVRKPPPPPAQESSASSVGGRREARAKTSPPTPPPMPGHTRNSACASYGQSKGGAKTTVSPTTSVDRGYESFQSCSSSCAQQQRARQSHSLPEYDRQGGQCEPACGGHSLPSDQQAPCTLAADHRAPRRAGHSPLVIRPAAASRPSSCGRPLEGEPEDDDDFYYCCAEPVHSSELHQVPAGGLLMSDYATHTYRHQEQSARPARAQRTVSAGRRAQAAASSSSLADTSARVHWRRAPEQSHTNTSNDLIPFCEQQHQQVICDKIAPWRAARQQQAPGARAQRGRARRGQSSERPAGGYYEQQGAGCLAFSGALNSSNSKKQLTWFDQVDRVDDFQQ